MACGDGVRRALVLLVSGAASLRDSPVDLALNGSSVYVAEKSNDSVLIYCHAMSSQGVMDMAVNEVNAITKREPATLQLQ